MPGINQYEDWKEFFHERLTANGQFALTNFFSESNNDIEIYSSLVGDTGTYIEVEYFSPMTLFSLKILNPATPGNNQQQHNEYFYRYQFTSGKDYGGVGLEFDKMNIAGINNLLSEGFLGQETIYYKNGKAIKSVLTPGISYYFSSDGFWKRLLKKITGHKERYDEVRVIMLNEIFNGI